MKRPGLSAGYIAAALVLLGLLVWLTIAAPPTLTNLLPWPLFIALIIFTDLFGVHLAGGIVSLLPMTTLAAYLVMGQVPTAWAAFVAALVQAVFRFRWAERSRVAPLTSILQGAMMAGANAVAHTSSVLVGGAVFRALQGETPLTAVAPRDVVPLVSFALAYLSTNHVAFVPALAARGEESLHDYLRSLPSLLFYEGSPLILSPLMAMIYTQLGVAPFLLFALAMIVASLVTRSLAQTSDRLERRVQELRALQAVGQALSANIEVDAVVSAVYDEVGRLMPARNFYVALYDPQTDEVSFPLSVEEGEPVEWPSRRTGSGLTEYVLRSAEPLLIRGDIKTKLEELNVDSLGREAECWLGVPVLVADEARGVIAVQSYEAADAYDVSHQEVLTTIASQAGVAIQNARLYARTDEALARRLQELRSILRTAREGILLLDADWHVMAVNRALADLVGVAQLQLPEHLLDPPQGAGDQSLIELLGYDEETLQADCQRWCDGTETGADGARNRTVVTRLASGRDVERTLTPVRSQEGTISGWLLVLRDVTEQIELGRMKDDLTQMLVHDLRSPLTVLENSFLLMEEAFAENDAELFGTLTGMAQRSSDRMSNLVSSLLDVNRLESAELELTRVAVDVGKLLDETVTQLSPLAASAEIETEVTVAQDLPPLLVDAGLIRRVLSNLVDNSLKFTPTRGCIRVWARLDPDSRGRHLLIGVTDEGPGIPEEERQRVFEKFHQVPTVRGRRSGTGLGLHFCKLAVEAHGGRIWVENALSEAASEQVGTTFVMTLPTASSEVSA